MSSEDILAAPPPPADVRVPYGSDSNQFGDFRLPRGRGPFPAVMNIHGGFWRAKYDLKHAGHLCAALTHEGLVTWNVEYRRVGNRGGGWPGSFQDVVSAYKFLHQNAKRYNVDGRRISVMGHSAGGQLALCLAAHQNIRVVSLAGVVDLEQAWKLHLSNDAVAEFLGGPPNRVSNRYREADPMQLSIGSAEQWIVHGLNDDVVPASFSENYVERKKKLHERAYFLPLPGCGHYEPIDPHSAAWPVVRQAVMGG